MGDAAKRKNREAVWRKSLSAEERVVVDVALRLSSILPLYGACYQSSFFLFYHLQKVHGLTGKAVVGFVNDGTDTTYCSHAWFTFNNAITDLAIARPLRPDVQHPGPLTIHGFEFKPGWRWSYHLCASLEDQKFFEQFRNHPVYGIQIQEEENIREKMSMISEDNDLIREYLDSADNGFTYDTLAKLVVL
jgi:hypothetical protein